MIRRLLQDAGVEVIHLGHNRSVQEVVLAALQEGAQGVAVSSYQGGHIEYYKYLRDLLNQMGAPYVKIFGGGGGVIVHSEKSEIEAYGISKIFHPEDGRRLGLEGMVELVVKECDFDPVKAWVPPQRTSFLEDRIPHSAVGMAVVSLENSGNVSASLIEGVGQFQHIETSPPPVVGITGTGGAGKSSLVDELIQRFLNSFPDKRIAVLCVDPTKRKSGGALLGDRIRMNSLGRGGLFVHSLASRSSGNELAAAVPRVLEFLKGLDFDLIVLETSGIGQSGSAISEISDHSIYVMTSEFGAQSQLEKIDMLDYADLIAINKADHRGSLDAVRDVEIQYKRSHKIFDSNVRLPIFLTQAAQFNDGGVNELFFALCEKLDWKRTEDSQLPKSHREVIIPSERQKYLSEVVDAVRNYRKRQEELSERASKAGTLFGAMKLVPQFKELLQKSFEEVALTQSEMDFLISYEQIYEDYAKEHFTYVVRGREIQQPLYRKTLSGTPIRRVVVPKLTDWGDRVRYLSFQNVPGNFPFTTGVFPLKREEEEPERQFAGEGPPERTNRRFHYLLRDSVAKRLSTAFDSVTLYGQDPDERPDIYGKVGESGVSVPTLDDLKRLYAGFDLCDPLTSISMTINGPAPMMLAFFFNAAMDQQIERRSSELKRPLSESEVREVKIETLKRVRGTVQADILKEDQGQNTCIFSIDFALKLMGDIQHYFIDHGVQNFYSVSISGYHIAEAGANPITQLAFTLANGFTYVEYYLSRGMKIDDFAPSLSFFFSNGLDPEYSVIGRVARRIWAVAMRDLYKGNDRSQKLKYHIQTSGRSLHSQDIDFNDIRTTLQAVIAIFDHCNSLHTNAFDEAITTPTEHSVRRAMAIQKIIHREFGIAKNENPLQGSYFIEELTDLVEEAVLLEFLRINERGGVLGAMERQYQRSKIQEESIHYEHLKHSGELPIIGVNTFIDPKTLKEDFVPEKIEMARATSEEKRSQLDRLHAFQERNRKDCEREVRHLKQTALKGENLFEALMSASRYCSLGQMTEALFEVGGKYRRNL